MEKLIWNKNGLLFNPKDYKSPLWMNEFAQAPHVLHFDNYIRVYFSCRPKPDEKGQYVSYSAFVDFDFDFKIIKISEEPILKLGKLGCFDEFGTYPVSVIKIENESHTFGNLLSRMLQDHEQIEFAGYKIDHLLIKELTIGYKTVGEDIVNILNDIIAESRYIFSTIKHEIESLKLK